MRFVPYPLRSAAAALCLLSVTLGLTACANGGQTGDEGAPRDGGDRNAFEQLGGSYGNYQPAGSLRELFNASEVVIVGRAMRIERGRTFQGTMPPSDTIETIVMHVSVLDTLKGDPGATLYLEFIGNAEVILPSTLPDERVLIFAKRAPQQPILLGGTIRDEGLGLPEGATLRVLTTPQGFAIETASGGATPLFEPTDTLLRDDSFDALVERIRGVAQTSTGGADASIDASRDASGEQDASGSSDAGTGDLDANLASDANIEVDAGPRIAFLQPMFFSLPINSIRYGVSGYDADNDVCVSVIWFLDSLDESRFCDIIDTESLLPYVVIAPGEPAGCWSYGPGGEILAQRGCVDFGDFVDLDDDNVDMEVDVVGAAWSGTVVFKSP